MHSQPHPGCFDKRWARSFGAARARVCVKKGGAFAPTAHHMLTTILTGGRGMVVEDRYVNLGAMTSYSQQMINVQITPVLATRQRARVLFRCYPLAEELSALMLTAHAGCRVRLHRLSVDSHASPGSTPKARQHPRHIMESHYVLGFSDKYHDC